MLRTRGQPPLGSEVLVRNPLPFFLLSQRGTCKPTLAEVPFVIGPSWLERQTAQLESQEGSWFSQA